MKNKKNISLIGMPAVGKSTVGLSLSQSLGLSFLDSDHLIETEEKRTLARIIADHGLPRFLSIEENHVLTIDCQDHIIATGGSVVYGKNAMAHLAEISTIVYLHVDLATLRTRLADLTARGVAIAPGKKVEDLYKERTPLYDAWCDLKIDCGTLTARQVSDKVLAHFS